MKLLLGMVLGFTMAGAPPVARQEPADKEKPKQEEAKKQEPPPKATPEKQEGPAPSAKQEKQDDKHQQQGDKQQQKERQKPSKEEDKNTRANDQPQAQPQNRQQNNHQQYAQESLGNGRRIPAQKFLADFGSEHHFRVEHLEEGRRFEYGGYAFELVEAWPADWSYDDECYIEQDADAYYLVDLVHPEVRVLVIVV